LGKRYLLGERAGASSALLRRPDRQELWALRGVDLVAESGEVVGIVGRNGAGKTTLLKLVARITEPTEGVVRTRGRVGALLEVGTGFHFELTGRENVFFNGAVLGMSRREIERRFDDIVEFSGVGSFLDTPLKRYSAGMYLRLAFSVAAHLETDIVLVDEVLAVGDAEFQRRCIARMSELTEEGRTVVFVSHDLGAIGRLCQRVIWIEQGGIQLDGRAAEVLERYRAAASPEEAVAVELIDPNPNAPAAFAAARIIDATGRAVFGVRRDEAVRVELEIAVRERLPELKLRVALLDRRRAIVVDDAWSPGAVDPGRYLVRVVVPPVLAAGEYTLRGALEDGRSAVDELDLIGVRLRPRLDERDQELVRARALQPRISWTVDALPNATPAG
jgi:ABC-2 type transport system ATP-binding protein/lipopolysaccharide transport system ATP-binding protein